MIMCHCNVISSQEIEEAVGKLLDEDPWRLIVPVQVYHALGKRGRCCGCFPGVVNIIVNVTAVHHARLATPETQVIAFIDKLRRELGRLENARNQVRVGLGEKFAA